MFLVLTGAITRAPLDRPRVAAALPRRASNRRTRPPAACAESARSGGPLGQSSLSRASLPRAAPITALAPSSSRPLACWPFTHLVVQHPRRPAEEPLPGEGLTRSDSPLARDDLPLLQSDWMGHPATEPPAKQEGKRPCGRRPAGIPHDYRPRWRAQALCWAPDHLTRAPLLRTDATTSRIAWVVAAASSSSAIKSSWTAPAMTRCTLLVDNVAMRFCAADRAASCPLPAVRTISGLSAKSPRAAACSAEAAAWTYSSIVLRSMLAVATLARTSSRDRGGRLPTANWAYRRPRPSRAAAETSAETRLMASEEPPWPDDGVPGFAADAGAVESTSTMPATSSG